MDDICEDPMSHAKQRSNRYIAVSRLTKEGRSLDEVMHLTGRAVRWSRQPVLILGNKLVTLQSLQDILHTLVLHALVRRQQYKFWSTTAVTACVYPLRRIYLRLYYDMRAVGLLGVLLLVLPIAVDLVAFGAARPLSDSNSLDFRQIPAEVFLPERVYFNPNNGEDNKVEDYIANVYFGEVDLAKADPVLAAAGAAVRAITNLCCCPHS